MEFDAELAYFSALAGLIAGSDFSMSFFDVVTAAINDLAEHGYDSQARVQRWVSEIRKEARATLTSPEVLEEALRGLLKASYDRLVVKGGLMRMHPGVSAFTLRNVKPKLHAELSRRISASADLIKLNRSKAIEQTLQRFSGWATSVPRGGSRAVDRKAVKLEIRKALTQLPFEERRVLIDQGHKFVSTLSSILATDGGAIAGRWHSHWRELNYDYRPDHKERDEKVYTIRGNWALEKGLMKAGPAGYTDEITHPAVEIFCRCSYQYLYSIQALPDDMVTARGRSELERVVQLYG